MTADAIGPALMRAPAAAEHARIDGAALAGWTVRALAALTRVARDPTGLISILERVQRMPELDVQVIDSPRRLRDRELPGFTEADWCLADTTVLVYLPAAEGLAAYARGAGLSARAAVGVPRAALRLHDE